MRERSSCPGKRLMGSGAISVDARPVCPRSGPRRSRRRTSNIQSASPGDAGSGLASRLDSDVGRAIAVLDALEVAVGACLAAVALVGLRRDRRFVVILASRTRRRWRCPCRRSSRRSAN